MRQTGNDNLIWHLSCQQDDQIGRIEMNMPENCGFLDNWRMKINFSRQKWKYSKSVFHWLVNLFTVRFLCLIMRLWDCPQNRETWEVCSWMGGGLSSALTNNYAWHCIVMKILYESTRIKNKKYNEKLNNAMYKFGWVLDKYRGGGGGMFVSSLNLKYVHFPFWGVCHVPLPGWYLPMLQFHLALLVTTLFYKALILQGETWCWSLLGLKG